MIRGRRSDEALTGSPQSEWRQYVDTLVSQAQHRPSKCLARRCIQGLDDALLLATSGRRVSEISTPPDTETMFAMLRTSEPKVLRGAATGWGPNVKWDAEHLARRAGDEPLEITVVTVDGKFEVTRCPLMTEPLCARTISIAHISRLGPCRPGIARASQPE